MTTQKIKSAAKTTGRSLFTVAAVLHNSGLSTRIHEIDTETETLQARIDELNEERARLEGSKISR